MTKIQRMVTIDYKVWEKARELNLNVSAVCEEALFKEVNKAKLSPFEQKKKVVNEAWEAQGKQVQEAQAVSEMKWAKEKEKECIAVNRDLWNETYRILKDRGTLPLPNNPVARVKVRAELFEVLRKGEVE